MNKILIILIGVLSLQISCTKTTEESEPTNTEQLDLDRVEFTTLTKRLITNVVECTGRIDVPPNERAALYAPIGGNISDIRVLPGDMVKQGQLLYRLSHQDIIKIQEEFLIAYNEEKLQKTNLERKQQLFEQNNISQRELRQTIRDYEVARANHESLMAQLKVIGISAKGLISQGIRSSIGIKAPISGYVSKVEAVAGAYVNMNSRIMTLVNTDHMHIELDVYANRIAEVKAGQKVGFRLAGDAKEHWGEVYLVGKEVDQDKRTVAVHAHMLNEEELVVGSYLYAGILTEADSLWAIPAAAIVNAEDKKYVVVKEGEQLTPIEIELGNSFKNYVAVKDPTVLTGKQLVAKDAYYYFE